MFSYMVLCPSEPRIVSIHCGVMSSVSGFFQGVLVYAPGAIFSQLLLVFGLLFVVLVQICRDKRNSLRIQIARRYGR